MRLVTILCLLVLASALAFGQVVVTGGTATTGPTVGVYAAPFVPRISTPMVSLSTVSPNPVGATNATYGNVAGATNSTLSIVTPPPTGVFTQPVLYNPTAPEPVLYFQTSTTAPAGNASMARSTGTGMASFEGSVSAAELMKSYGPAKKATRTITNDDIDRFNQSTGTVKYNGKTEQMK